MNFFSIPLLINQLIPYQPAMPCTRELWYSCHTPLLLFTLLIATFHKIPDLNLTLGHAVTFWLFGAYIHIDLLIFGAILSSVFETLRSKAKLSTIKNLPYVEFYPFLGVYVGCFAIPLDWDVHWQYFPYLSLHLGLLIADIFGFILYLNPIEKIKTQ
eukprot:NODE_6_length_70510_cov_1.054395.p51 type:complete len:157 gc:universal NODE_6_length_70510_cov_1.054395:3372-2902(-)